MASPQGGGRHTGIAPANLEAVLNSAANAVHKGQAAWFTPAEWSEMLALPLPGYRPVIADLTCGNGQLLAGVAAASTYHRLGCDIEALSDDPAPEASDSPRSPIMGVRKDFIQADITLLARYLHRTNWTCDLFALNFPFDHHWYRDRLDFLAESRCAAVEIAFCHHDGRTSKDTIDSTVAGLCLALDSCSPFGEGFVIANNATVERLIFAENAPHAMLAAHIWCRLTIPGNICDLKPRTDGTDYQTAVLYFARAHTGGVNKELVLNPADYDSHDDFMRAVRYDLAQIGKSRLGLRAGPVIRQYEGGHTVNTAELWEAIGLEWRTDQNQNRPDDRRWNIWLNANGTLDTNLTPFQEACEPLKKEQYVRLHALKGKHPMQLILQKAERKELERAVFGDIWRVGPAVVEAVQGALAEYNAVRAPLYPLSRIQSLGYLDDNDDILCLKDLPGFHAGERYTIRTETISVQRSGRRMNVTGELDDVQWEGSELAMFIRDSHGIERLFMEERLKAKDVRLSIQDENAPSPIEFNLQHLVEHFAIP